MQHFIKLGLLLSLIVCFSIVQAQIYTVPEGYSFKTKEDYAKYNDDIAKTIEWLSSNSPTQSPVKRKKANAFFLKWLTGTPAVSATLYPEILELSKINPELLTIFLGQWTKFVFDNPGKEPGTKRIFRASLQGMLTYYKTYKGKGLKKDKTVDSLLKKQRKGQLDKWIDKVVK